MHTFKIVLDREPSDEEYDVLADVGCDDAAFGVENGISVAEFDRESETLIQALSSAIRDVESVGLKVVRVLDGDLLTLADIADRIGRSRESIRRYAVGTRGSGDFPPPVNPDGGGTAFYRWSEVAPWLRSHLGVDAPDGDDSLVVVNLALQLRQFKDRVVGFSKALDLIYVDEAEGYRYVPTKAVSDVAASKTRHLFVDALRKSYEIDFLPNLLVVPSVVQEDFLLATSVSLAITRRLVDELSQERRTDPEDILDELDRSGT
jgi:hypothetical protein